MKNEQTPNSILAQLVDITRGKKNEVARGLDTISCNNVLQRRSIARERMAAAKGCNSMTCISTHTNTTSTISNLVANNSYNSTSTSEHVKAHKSIQCGGCGVYY